MKPIFERTKESDDHLGWVFPATGDEVPGAAPDPFNGAKTVRELYEIASTNYTGKPTVPVSLDQGKNSFIFYIPAILIGLTSLHCAGSVG